MIKCAAIISNGETYTGKTHREIIRANGGRIGFGQRGFLTNDGKFLNRAAAGKHAYECGQIDKLEPLYSDMIEELI